MTNAQQGPTKPEVPRKRSAKPAPTNPTPADREVDYANEALSTDVGLISRRLEEVFATRYPAGGKATVGGIPIGIYAFFDYDHEPIYVGQTRERVGTRVRRHLTGMRSDSVAKFVLDPFEVRTMKIWPLPHLLADFPIPEGGKRSTEVNKLLKAELDAYEYSVYQMVLHGSAQKAVLNEGSLSKTSTVRTLDEPLVFEIIPLEVFEERAHADLRIARRAQTIANLARHISERNASDGLRRALNTQAERLFALSSRRLDGLGIGAGGLAFIEIEDDEESPEY